MVAPGVDTYGNIEFIQERLALARAQVLDRYLIKATQQQTRLLCREPGRTGIHRLAVRLRLLWLGLGLYGLAAARRVERVEDALATLSINS
ncbi:hypothetical protein BH23BAC4_BH23BAC4_06700 [soil metagenome]